MAKLRKSEPHGARYWAACNADGLEADFLKYEDEEIGLYSMHLLFTSRQSAEKYREYNGFEAVKEIKIQIMEAA